jgi:hypothetical protein
VLLSYDLLTFKIFEACTHFLVFAGFARLIAGVENSAPMDSLVWSCGCCAAALGYRKNHAADATQGRCFFHTADVFLARVIFDSAWTAATIVVIRGNVHSMSQQRFRGAGLSSDAPSPSSAERGLRSDITVL